MMATDGGHQEARTDLDHPGYLRHCVYPRCQTTFHAIRGPADDWRMGTSGPLGSEYICPVHTPVVLVHQPTWTHVDSTLVGVRCSCGEWEWRPAERTPHGVYLETWKFHLTQLAGRVPPALPAGGRMFSYNYTENGLDSSGRLSIGADLNLFLDAVRWTARSRVIRPVTIQRHVRVGWVKAIRLTILLEQEGMIGPPDDGGGHQPLVTADSLDAALERVRETAAAEDVQ